MLKIFTRIPDLKGWRYEQLLFIYGMTQLSHGLFGFLFWGMYDLGRILYSGEFDLILIRPIHPLLQMMINRLGDFGSMLTGIGLIAYAISQGIFQVNLLNLLLLIIFVCCGALLFLFLYALIAGVSLFVANTSEILLDILGVLELFGNYPINIYSPLIRIFLTFLIPVAYVGFYPAAYFLNGSFSMYALFQPVIVVILGAITLLIWKTGIRKYQSTGN